MTTGAYSSLDRLVHKIAFSSRSLQLSMADMEDSMFAKDTQDTDPSRPIFVTSLPRAGTTILLTALSHIPTLATHLYRDMPFVMAPLFWSKVSKSFRKSTTMAERAHGDGIKVGFDSPEAFEEIIWKAFWPDHYNADHIEMWQETARNGEAETFLRSHFAKIIALRCGELKSEGRYISKNNGNVARIPLLRSIFPQCSIVIPVREPVAHAASLLRQHQNFTKQHAQDSFIRRYMSDIGHFEFGDLHRPIAFPGFTELSDGTGPDDLAYWVAYWVAAFEHLRDLDQGQVFVGHAALCNGGESAVAELCARIDLDPAETLSTIASEFKARQEKPIDHTLPVALHDRATSLFAALTGE